MIDFDLLSTARYVLQVVSSDFTCIKFGFERLHSDYYLAQVQNTFLSLGSPPHENLKPGFILVVLIMLVVLSDAVHPHIYHFTGSRYN